MVDGRDSVPARPNSIELNHPYQPHHSTPTNHNSHGNLLNI